MKLSAAVLDNITSSMPSSHVPSQTFGDIQHLSLADPNFHKPRPIDLLLGVDVHSIIHRGPTQFISSNVIAENTLLGYIIRGKIPIPTTKSSPLTMTTRPFCTKTSNKNLTLKKCPKTVPNDNAKGACEREHSRSFIPNSNFCTEPYSNSLSLLKVGVHFLCFFVLQALIRGKNTISVLFKPSSFHWSIFSIYSCLQKQNSTIQTCNVIKMD